MQKDHTNYIKVLDRRLFGGEEGTHPIVHYRGAALEQHLVRVEEHCRRVEAAENLLRSNGIDPHSKGSAWAYDKITANSR